MSGHLCETGSVAVALATHDNPRATTEVAADGQFGQDLRAGLTCSPKRLPSRWLYEEAGSELFERITHPDEYYPTRAERAILVEHASSVAVISGAKTVVELGSGASDKTVLLLDAFDQLGKLSAFVAVDVAEPVLRRSVVDLANRYPKVAVSGLVADFGQLAAPLMDGTARSVAFLGGTVGNLASMDRKSFLSHLAELLDNGEHLLVGADLVKDPVRLLAAYDDPGGVTAAFEKNVLSLNARLGANFDVDRFSYVVRWDPSAEVIEMGRRSEGVQDVTVAALDLLVHFEDGEDLLTEISAKFSLSGIAEEEVRTWTEALARPLSGEDQSIQSMPDVSSTKWHRAHVTWLFEQFVVGPNCSGYRPMDERFSYLFNSYYEGAGPRHARDKPGLLSRPGVGEVAGYRQTVDEAMERLLSSEPSPSVAALVELGLHHEQQHQELPLMDVKHVLSMNPLVPAYRPDPMAATSDRKRESQGEAEQSFGWICHPGGPVETGHHRPVGSRGDIDLSGGFVFDNGRPRHKAWLNGFALADRLVTVGEWLAFMEDGGYERPDLWLSDGWAVNVTEDRRAPLYWCRRLRSLGRGATSQRSRVGDSGHEFGRTRPRRTSPSPAKCSSIPRLWCHEAALR